MADSSKSALIGICFTAKQKITDQNPDRDLEIAKDLVLAALGADWHTDYLNTFRTILIARPKTIQNDLGDRDYENKMWKLAIKLTHEDKDDFFEFMPMPMFEYYTIDGQPNPCTPNVNLPVNWHIKNSEGLRYSIDADKAWALESPTGKNKGEGVRIGHIDSGYSTHFELFDKPNFLYRQGYREKFIGSKNWDAVFNLEGPFTDTASSLNDLSGHGTGTAGLILGGENEYSVFQGVAPKAEVLPMNVANFVIITPEKLIKAVEYAIQNNCHVLSISLGWGNFDPTTVLSDIALSKAIFQYGIIPVAASGQPNMVMNALATYSYPGRSSWVIACAAYDECGKPWDYNVTGSHVKVCAPGVNVFKPDYHFEKNPIGMHGVSQGCGTSFSTAITAGVVANWLSFWGRDNLKKKYGNNLFFAFYYDFYMSCQPKDGVPVDDWLEKHDGKGHGHGRINLNRLLQQRPKKFDDWPTLKEVMEFYGKKFGTEPIVRYLEQFAKYFSMEFTLVKNVLTFLLAIPFLNVIVGFALIVVVSILLAVMTYGFILSTFRLIAFEENIERKKELREKLREQLKENNLSEEVINAISSN